MEKCNDPSLSCERDLWPLCCCVNQLNCSLPQKPEGGVGGQPRKRLSSEGVGGATAAKRKPSPIRFESSGGGAGQKREDQSMYAPPRDRYSKNLANGANFDSYNRGRGFRRGRGRGFRGRGRQRGSWNWTLYFRLTQYFPSSLFVQLNPFTHTHYVTHLCIIATITTTVSYNTLFLSLCYCLHRWW